MAETKSLPCTVFDHVVWQLQGADGASRRGAIQRGECLLLFTSLDALHDYLSRCREAEEGGAPDAELRAAVFSRSRKEFGRRAREAARTGIVGALFDPSGGQGEAPFLQFSRAAR